MNEHSLFLALPAPTPVRLVDQSNQRLNMRCVLTDVERVLPGFDRPAKVGEGQASHGSRGLAADQLVRTRPPDAPSVPRGVRGRPCEADRAHQSRAFSAGMGCGLTAVERTTAVENEIVS